MKKIGLLLPVLEECVWEALASNPKRFEITPSASLTIENYYITQGSEVEKTLSKFNLDVVIHCAAMTAVDLCESKQFDAWKMNAFGCYATT